MSSGREFQSVNALLKDLSRPQFVFDLIDLDLIVSLERVLHRSFLHNLGEDA